MQAGGSFMRTSERRQQADPTMPAPKGGAGRGKAKRRYESPAIERSEIAHETKAGFPSGGLLPFWLPRISS